MVKSGRDKKGSDVLARYVVICIAAAIISFSVIPILGLATQQTGDTVTVAVNAPEYVEGTFDAAIDVDSIVDFNSGQFDLSFDSRVLNVTDVNDGEINGEAVPIFMWSFVDTETVRVLVSMPMGKGVSGSGYLAEVEFEVKGKSGDKSNLNISNGLLVDIEAKEIEAVWHGAEVRISGEEQEPAPTPEEEAPLEEKTTPQPTAPPIPEEKPKPTPKPAVPGFEAIFAIAGILSIAYILQRRR
ncbi:MAG: cohesin domain-containing protein [Methanophagales archaeon]|nr:cohesin domain-containing protein [Methanophagales archaeon]